MRTVVQRSGHFERLPHGVPLRWRDAVPPCGGIDTDTFTDNRGIVGQIGEAGCVEVLDIFGAPGRN